MTARSARPLSVPSLPGKQKGSTENNRLSTCSRCGLGIFRTQPYRWGIGAELGMVHDFEGADPCNP